MSKIKLSVKQWSDDDKPREKILQKGIKSVSDAELIAILIGSGCGDENAVELAKRILNGANNKLSQLADTSIDELMKSYKGVGAAKAISILAAMELGYRACHEDPEKIEVASMSQDAYKAIYSKIGNIAHEEFWVIHLNNANKILYKQHVASGGLTRTAVDIRIIFKAAMEKGSTGLILAHNHPSGRLHPSAEDINLTKTVKNAANIFDIRVLDHIIVGNESIAPLPYYSFADDGMMP